jgi:hypothetical protein
MKKFLVILLALLMCLSVVACDSKKKKSDDDDEDDEKEASESTVTASSDVDGAVKTAIEVVYGLNNRKVEDLWPVTLECNLDLVDLVTDKEEAEELKTRVENYRERIKGEIKIQQENHSNPFGEDVTNVKLEYKILYSDIYNNKTTKFEEAVNSRFPFENSEIKEKIEEIAIVEVYFSYSGTRNGEPVRENDDETIYCFKINGKWYVSLR